MIKKLLKKITEEEEEEDLKKRVKEMFIINIKYIGLIVFLAISFILFANDSDQTKSYVIILSMIYILIVAIQTILVDTFLLLSIKFKYISLIMLGSIIFGIYIITTIIYELNLLIKLSIYATTGFFAIYSLSSLIAAIIFVLSINKQFIEIKKLLQSNYK